jgi:hypothetical protein
VTERSVRVGYGDIDQAEGRCAMRFSLSDLRQWLRNGALIGLGAGLLILSDDSEEIKFFCVVFTAFGLPSLIYHIWFKEYDEDRKYKKISALYE